MEQNERNPVTEIPVNKRAYRMSEDGNGLLHSVTGAAYKKLADGSVRRVSGKMNKHLRRKHGLKAYTNAQVQQAVNVERAAQQTNG